MRCGEWCSKTFLFWWNGGEASADFVWLGRIHKRLIDLNAPTEVVKQIIINIEAGVEVEVTIAA